VAIEGDVDQHPDRDGRERYLRHAVREAFESGAIDIAAPDLQKARRLLEGRRIADYADTHYVSVAPDSLASPIGTVAAVRVAAAVPNSLALEWHGMRASRSGRTSRRAETAR
jgi:L-alanine-DL-glutamate epimerase-like enolase superfamily enzyme